ncbi:MAG: S8 family serine peptidase [Pseudomonadota bacterium]
MKRLWYLALAFVAVACAPLTTPEEPAQGIVTFAQAAPRLLVPAEQASTDRHIIVVVDLAPAESLAATGDALARDHPLTLEASWPLAAIEVHCFVFRLDEGVSRDAVLSDLAADPRVQQAQPMQRFATLERDPTSGVDANPAVRGLALADLHRTVTGAGVKVGIVDTMPDILHPDLAGSFAKAQDFVGNDPPPAPERHGTAVAGIIAASPAGAQGLEGVAPGASLVGLRACWEGPAGEGRCTSFSIARAMNFAIARDLDVINLSLAGPADPLVAALIEEALSRGTVVVAALGPSREASFPATHPGVVAVDAAAAAVESAAKAALVAELGAVRAPGQDLLSTAPGAGYDFFSGSSVAAAVVTGVAALLVEHDPQAAASTLTAALRSDPVLDPCGALRRLDPAREPDGCSDP